jgi:DNA polymerase-3 subunit epsilon
VYAVLDVETTGLSPTRHDRIAEVGLVLLDGNGAIEAEWSTLVNPNRDLGPQHIHGITAKDVLEAPPFESIAGYLLTMLAGRTLVAHNLAFDLLFLTAEFNRLGVEFPVQREQGLCTMNMSSSLLPGSGRSLYDCCTSAGVQMKGMHDALSDARAAAELLRYCLSRAGSPPPWMPLVASCSQIRWPALPPVSFVPRARDAHRSPSEPTPSFISGLISFLPRVDSSELADPYLAVLDQALSDRYLSSDETAALAALAHSLGLTADRIGQLHRDYLDALARISLADGELSDEELADLRWVADILQLGAPAVAEALTRAGHTTVRPAEVAASLSPGDMIVFTGETAEPREVWINRAEERGYITPRSVTKDVRLVVAADPDSLSGKAKKARGYNIPIVSLEDFRDMIGC